MKRKQFERKLGLNKITVSNLSLSQLSQILGGGEPECTIYCSTECTLQCITTAKDPLDDYWGPGTSHGVDDTEL